jgi:hypothetical protein
LESQELSLYYRRSDLQECVAVAIEPTHLSNNHYSQGVQMSPSSYPLQNGHTQHIVPDDDASDQGGQDENLAIDTDHADTSSVSANAWDGIDAGMGQGEQANGVHESDETTNFVPPNSDNNSVVAGGPIIGGMQYEDGTGSNPAENGVHSESMANGHPND